MVKRFDFGNPFFTGAVVKDIALCSDKLPFFEVSLENGISFVYKMQESDVVYGLGEANRGINKRGHIYESFCSDDPFHTEEKSSLYGAHNFLLLDGADRFGVFFDYPTRLKFDIDYSKKDVLEVSCDKGDISVYVITGDSNKDIVKQFREIIGQSYIPPRWAFGFQQSRWSYPDEKSVRNVVEGYKKYDMLLDAVILDIDYMTEYMDFTVDKTKFPDLQKLSQELKEDGIRLIPIIDAGVKIKDGYDVYEQGVENDYFCKTADGKNFEAAVWPGLTHFPDFFNPKTQNWFGDKYKILTDMGIEGFWNDMNEPAIFYTKRGIDEACEVFDKTDKSNMDCGKFFSMKDAVLAVSNNMTDYKSFYHNVDGKQVCHYDVHNLYGYYMTKAAGEAFERNCPDKRILLYSRASYIGMHRYGGIWTGDNHSWWSHILLNLKMLPSLSMCGFLYSGADLGGFNANASRDLLMRWTALGVFTPLMRNHSACGTRQQELYMFDKPEDFKVFVDFRHKFIPYLYSEYMKSALNNEMLFRPLSFDYPEDEFARSVEDQVMLGEGVMIAPVYTQNAVGRYVYLPENMTLVRVNKSCVTQEKMQKGHHFVNVPIDELVFFIKENHIVPLSIDVKCADSVDIDNLELLGDGEKYKMYWDDGFTRDYNNSEFITIEKK